MRKKFFVAFLILTLLGSISPVSLANGSGSEGKGPTRVGPERTQAIEKLKQMSDGDLILDQDGEQVFLSGKLAAKQAVGSASAIQFLNTYKSLFGIDDAAKELRKQKTIKGAGGDTIIRFDQLIGGIPVEGNALNVHFSRDGSIVSVNGNFQKDKAITALGSGTITDADAVETAKKQFTYASLSNAPSAQRVVLTKDGKNFDTYKVNIAYTEPDFGNYDVYVEAHTGEVVHTESNIRYDGNVTGTGVDVTGVTRDLYLRYNAASGSYWMQDLIRLANGIKTYDAQHTTTGGPIVSSMTTGFSSENYKASVSAHYFAGKVIDFYKQIFNRNSLDDNGMAIKSFTHYDTNYNNAFWTGSEMVYGDGDGTEFTYLSGDLDVVGHEMTHGVISNTADLDYHNQSGALNESLADTFGVLIETYDKYNVGSGGAWNFDPADWVIGDQIYTPGVDGDALRSLEDPTLYGQPDNMLDYQNQPDDYWGDWGGVHTNSGIPNKAAFLIAQNIGMQETAQIYYAALSQYMSPSTDFTQAKNYLVQAATDLYGADSSEVSAVNSAFLAVGVGAPPFDDPYEPNDTFDTAYQITPGATYQSYISANLDCDYYQFSVNYTGNIHLSLANLPNTYILYLYGPDHSFIDDVVSWDMSPISLDYTVTSPGTYYAEVEGYYCHSRDQKYSLSVTTPGAPVAVTGVSLDQHTLDMMIGAGSTTLVATVSPANALNKAVTWSSDHTDVATVDSAGKVTAVASGTATITATTEDGGFTDACQVTVSSIPVTGVSLDRHTQNLRPGDSVRLVATVSPANATNRTVTWSSNRPDIATVDSMGIVTPVGKGNATITATTVDGGFTDACQVTVLQPVTGVSLDKHTVSLPVNGTTALVATVTPSNADDKGVTWSSSDNTIASIDDSGNVTAVSLGTASIIATTSDGGFRDICYVTVAKPVTGVSLDRHTVNTPISNTLQLVATVAPSDATYKDITWTSSDNNIVRAGFGGYVTAVGVGTATITATTDDGHFTDSCVITVTQPVTGISLNKYSVSIYPWETVALTATVSPNNATNKDIVWSSSNPEIASVSSSGFVTAGTSGYAWITATTADGKFAASCTIGVKWLDFPVFTLTSNSYNSVRIDITPVVGANGYAISRYKQFEEPTVIATTTSTTYVDSGLTCGDSYYYSIRAYRDGTTRMYGYSNTDTVIPVPSAPVVTAAVAYNSVRLSWGAVEGVTQYEIYRSTSPTGSYTYLGHGGTTGYTDTGVKTGTTYYYKARGIYWSGLAGQVSDYSAIVTARPAPAVPASVKAAAASYNSIKVSWGAVSGATKYEVYRSTSPGDGYKLIGTTSSRYLTNSGVQTGTTYYYQVRAYRLVGKTKVYSDFCGIVNATANLSTPTSLKAARAGVAGVKLSWGSVSGASGYEVWRATSPTDEYTNIKTLTGRSFTNTGLTAGSTYYYKVRAYRVISGRKIYGAFSMPGKAVR